MTPLRRLQAWYHSQCDDEWEHIYGVTITSLDNPGWLVEIGVRDTDLEGKAFVRIERQATDTDWVQAWSTGTEFKAACGPRNLDECLTIFLDWAESK